MLRLHKMGRAYGATPAELTGNEVAGWQGFIINTSAAMTGDEYQAAQVKRAPIVFPVAVIE